ncbi:MAG: hypothetical protein ABR594_11350 [Pyrinomonadaceae bacterium]
MINTNEPRPTPTGVGGFFGGGDTGIIPDNPGGGEGGEVGGGSGGGDITVTATPDPKKEKKCADLANRIQQLRDELARRTDELVEDKLKLPATGKFSIKGHQQQFRNKQSELREKIDEFNTRGCGGALPYDARDFATNPVPAPGKRNLPVHRIITPAPRPIPIPPAVVPAIRPSVPGFVPLPVIIIKCFVMKLCGGGEA